MIASVEHPLKLKPFTHSTLELVAPLTDITRQKHSLHLPNTLIITLFSDKKCNILFTSTSSFISIKLLIWRSFRGRCFSGNPERSDSFGAEQMGHRDSSQVPPVLAVRSETHRAVEEELVGRLLHGVIGKCRDVENVLGRAGMA
ncbi:hypothetical protein U1Q18_021115 [Sarracenia purpurea var. burkii]